MYQASVKKILSKSDPENLEKKIENWCQENPQDSFYFRPCALSASSTASESMNNEETDQNCVRDDILFAHQIAWQKQLMIRYGNEITLLQCNKQWGSPNLFSSYKYLKVFLTSYTVAVV